MELKVKYLSLILAAFLTSLVNAQNQPPPSASYFNPHLSSDGRKIVFECDRGGKFAIYSINADGTDLRKLTDDNSVNGQARWSPDSKQIVFLSKRDGNTQIYLMEADGSNQRRLTNGPDFDSRPDFSPNGDYVAFQSRPPGNGTWSDIYLIRTDGTGRKRLTDGKDNYVTPRWSPDGKKIVFSTISEFTKLVPNFSPETFMKLSADERFKFAEKQRNSSEIYIMEADGSKVKRLTNNEVRDDQVEWSRKSKTIYFMSSRDGQANFYEMKSDGTGVNRVMDGKAINFLNSSSDGKFFVYEKYVNDKSGLYLYNLETKEEKLLIEG